MKNRLDNIHRKIDGTYYVVEVVPDSGAKKLQIASAYIEKERAPRALNMANAPQLTSETLNASTLSKTRITEKSTEVNRRLAPIVSAYIEKAEQKPAEVGQLLDAQAPSSYVRNETAISTSKKGAMRPRRHLLSKDIMPQTCPRQSPLIIK